MAAVIQPPVELPQMVEGPYDARFFRVEAINCGEDPTEEGITIDFSTLTGG